MRLSVVIPVYNEEASLTLLFDKIKSSVSQANLGPFEVIFVDDGSTDQSWTVIQELAGANPDQVKGIRQRRNFGKADALSVGFAQVSGEIVFTMDADLQDDPAEIPHFVEKIETEGYDMVSGWKRKRHDPIDKTLPSRFFNAMTRFLTGVKLHDFNCGFKAYRREVVKDLPLYGELHRFIPVFANADGFRVGELVVQHHPRQFGKSKYGFERFMKGFLDLVSVSVMTRFGRRPGHFFGGVGALVGIVGFVILLALWIGQQMGIYINARPLFFFGNLCVMVAVQLVTTGVLAELFLRQSTAHPSPKILPRTRSIKERVGFDQP